MPCGESPSELILPLYLYITLYAIYISCVCKLLTAILHALAQGMHIAAQLINKTQVAHSFQLLNLSIEPGHVVAVDPGMSDTR